MILDPARSSPEEAERLLRPSHLNPRVRRGPELVFGMTIVLDALPVESVHGPSVAHVVVHFFFSVVGAALCIRMRYSKAA